MSVGSFDFDSDPDFDPDGTWPFLLTIPLELHHSNSDHIPQL
jgi:hypothetical protein